MAQPFRPLYLRQLAIRLPGLTVRRLRLHRHLPEAEKVARHQHAYSQLLLYLGGKGVQHVGDVPWSIHPGTVCFIPSHRLHEFREVSGRRPLCLVIEIDLRGGSRFGARRAQLSHADLRTIRHYLARLAQWKNSERRETYLLIGATVLEMMHLLLKRVGWFPEEKKTWGNAPIVRAVEKVMHRAGNEWLTPKQIAQALDYQVDYLNRAVKKASGLSLGQWCAQKRMERVKKDLIQNLTIKEVAEKNGFLDQNYFARWFRKQIGETPSVWRSRQAS